MCVAATTPSSLPLLVAVYIRRKVPVRRCCLYRFAVAVAVIMAVAAWRLPSLSIHRHPRPSLSLSLSLSLSRLFYVAICMYVSRLRHVGCLTDERRRYQVNLLSTSKRFAVVATDTLACVKAASIYNVDHHRSSTTTPAPAAWWLRQRANSLRSLMMLTIDTSALTHSSRTCSLSHSMLSEPPRKTTKKHTLGDTGTTQLAHADH